ncbi:MAG TPA: phosphatase domain-containing protein [Aggregatilineaceae bacterium]|nr:phosphatase domain-containing protein [Aggregatilineaceae bacterium]
MSDWKTAIAKIATHVEEHYDSLKYRLRQKLGFGPVTILTYLGHGTRHKLYLKGRVLTGYDVLSAHDNDSLWDNLLNMYRRFDSHEIPYTRVRARFGDQTHQLLTDEEGFFEVQIQLDDILPTDQIWYDIHLELPDFAGQDGANAVGRVLVPPPDAQFGIISDLDDTIIQTDVLHWVKMARNTFLYNSKTRLPFAGVAEFYTALQKGTRSTYNPIYYVSNSPWNLYDLLVDFFEVRGIPLGAFFLLDLGLTEDHLVRPDTEAHKQGRIEEIMLAHPNLPFLLIGDSSEHDPEIYLWAVQQFPGRIPAVYIRDVSGAQRDQGMQDLIQQARAVGTEMLLVPDTVAAALHAMEHGYIAPDSLPAIRQEREEDKKEAAPVEKLIDQMG